MRCVHARADSAIGAPYRHPRQAQRRRQHRPPLHDSSRLAHRRAAVLFVSIWIRQPRDCRRAHRWRRPLMLCDGRQRQLRRKRSTRWHDSCRHHCCSRLSLVTSHRLARRSMNGNNNMKRLIAMRSMKFHLSVTHRSSDCNNHSTNNNRIVAAISNSNWTPPTVFLDPTRCHLRSPTCTRRSGHHTRWSRLHHTRTIRRPCNSKWRPFRNRPLRRSFMC